jgi:3-hydroxyisobutyrate dehydrogenase-like beta-hydroxyacid dehydrogenase
MTPQQIGILHPGEMGISIAASAQNGGHQVAWASEGRSADTRARAAKFGLHDAQTLAKLCANVRS